MMELRKEVQWFSEQMEQKLIQNDYKGGWKDCEMIFLFENLTNQLGNMMIEYSTMEETGDSTKQLIINNAVNLANFAMMIADNCKEKPS